MSMIILGLHGSVSNIDENIFDIHYEHAHDAGAVLFEDGRLVAAFEEERLNRIKHTNKFPLSSIRACLRRRNIGLEQVDLIAIPMDEAIYDFNISAYRDRDPSFTFETAREFLTSMLSEFQTSGEKPDLRKFRFINHHHAHAASSFFASGFQTSLVVTLDGVGDEQSGGIYMGRENSIADVRKFSQKDSLGHFYLDITRALGFKFFDEYKVMGLASYGDPTKYKHVFDTLYQLRANGDYEIFKEKLRDIGSILPTREPGASIGQCHSDVAAAVQNAIENIVFHILTYYRKVTANRFLCLAGGVGLNCVMTGKLRYINLFDDIYVQPLSHDGGLPLGAAMAVYYDQRNTGTRYRMRNIYIGTNCPEEDKCEEILSRWKDAIRFERSTDVAAHAARLIKEGNVIGWFQGASEYGPRALGHRSILADPRPAENKELINSKIKMREGFRPFAPSILREEVDRYFDLPDENKEYSYMTFVLKVKEEYRSTLAAVTHSDGSARLHTVSKEDNFRYYRLIREFRELTGTPVLLNTSFNNNYEPIVDTPDEAICCFLTTDLDYLVIGDFMVCKDRPWQEFLLWTIPVVAPYIKLKSYVKEGKVRHFVGNTYNKEEFPISDLVYRIYQASDGKRCLNCLLQEISGLQGYNKEGIVEEIKNLWSLRILDMRSTPLD
jgi:carbamoyltransferase